MVIYYAGCHFVTQKDLLYSSISYLQMHFPLHTSLVKADMFFSKDPSVLHSRSFTMEASRLCTHSQAPILQRPEVKSCYFFVSVQTKPFHLPPIRYERSTRPSFNDSITIVNSSFISFFSFEQLVHKVSYNNFRNLFGRNFRYSKANKNMSYSQMIK